MAYFEDGGRLYEFMVVSGPGPDGWDVECFDMTSGGPGLLGIVRVVPGGSAVISLRSEVSVTCLRRWLAFAEMEAGLTPGVG